MANTPISRSGRRGLLRAVAGLALAVLLGLPGMNDAGAQQRKAPAQKWVATWTSSVHGPYPSGNATAGPDMRFAFPNPSTGAVDQSFRLMVRPDLWGRQVRMRFANTFGDRPVTLDGFHVGLQGVGGNVVKGTNTRFTVGGRNAVTIQPGESVWSDPVTLNFVDERSRRLLEGKRLAVSFHVAGTAGAMTWHAKAMTTSYVSAPNAGSHGGEDGDAAFPYSSASWYFLDAVDVRAPAATQVIAAFGDSITDGTNTTMNGDDRWGDVLSRRLKAAYGDRWVVVNQGIGGNQVVGPATYTVQQPFPGGPSALSRLERDVFSISGLSTIILLEGINDFGTGKASAEEVIAGMREIVRRVRAKGGVKIFAATLTSSLNSTNAAYAPPEVDAKRKALNDFIRSSGIFDGVFDFDAATIDRATGAIKVEFQPNSTVGGPGDLLHPNRAGLAAMGNAIDIRVFAPPVAARRR